MKSKLLTWLLSSYDNSSKGASAKKLSAFLFMLLIVYLHFTYCDYDNAVEFLFIDAGSVLGLLGVSSWEKLRRNNGKENQSTEVS